MRRSTVGLAVLLVAVSVVVPVASGSEDGNQLPGGPETGASQVLQDGVAWWLDRKDDRGCLAARTDESGNAGMTDWGTLAVTAAGGDPTQGNPSLVDGLRACDPGSDAPPDDLARHILAIAAAGQDPNGFDGTDWMGELRDHWTGNQFLTDGRPDLINDDIFAVLALRAGGASPNDHQVQGAGEFVLDNQQSNGGWSHTIDTGSGDATPDMTGAALQAVTAAGVAGPGHQPVQDALDYLAGLTPTGSGCVGSRFSAVSSTGWAVLGLLAGHADPRSSSFADDRGVWDCLRSAQVSDGGFATEPGGEDSDWRATVDALVGLSGAPFHRVHRALDRPSATFSTSSTPTVDESTTLKASDVPFAGWQLPDGWLLEGARAEWTPQSAGEVAIDVLLLDTSGVAGEGTFEVTVEEADDSSDSGGSGGASTTADGTPPSIDLPGRIPAERNVSRSITVDATPADDPVVELKVDWGDGDATGWQASADFAHAYASLGEHTLTAWARDADGDVGRSSTTVEVVDASPRIEIDGPASVNRTEPAIFTAAVEDPDGPTPGIRWAAGDRTAEGPAASFSFQAPGEHRVEAVATDQAGNTAEATHTIEALNRAPDQPTVRPAEVPANESVVLRANASDPDGDRLAFAWTPPGASQPSAWGSQLHLETGSPGTVELTVNASDGRGGWTTARVEFTVTEASDQGSDEAAERIETSSSDRPPADDPPAPAVPSPKQPTVDLPGSLTVRSDRTTLLSGTAQDPDGSVDRVVVELGGRLPVQGASDFTARVPALPPGTYTLQAYAIDRAGHAGPPANLTLEVHAPPADEPVTATGGAEPADVPIPTGAALVGLVAAGLATRRVKP